MAASSATGTLTKGKPPRGHPKKSAAGRRSDSADGSRQRSARRASSSRRRRRAYAISRAELDWLLTDAHTGPGKQRKTDRADRAYRAIIRRAHVDGPVYETTYGQFAKAMGYETIGERDADYRYKSRVQNALNDLQALNLISWGGITRANGQWRCLEIIILPSSEPRGRARAGLCARMDVT